MNPSGRSRYSFEIHQAAERLRVGIAFDIRPTPITDFTNDPNRIRQTIDILLRNSPRFARTIFTTR
jgi:hypothetical protein